MSFFKPRGVTAPPDYMDRVRAGFEISNALMVNGSHLSNAFVQARDILSKDYASFGCQAALDDTISAYQWFLVSGLIGPTFNKAQFDDKAVALVNTIISMTEAFDQKGVDVRPVLKPVLAGIVEEMRLVNMLEN